MLVAQGYLNMWARELDYSKAKMGTEGQNVLIKFILVLGGHNKHLESQHETCASWGLAMTRIVFG